MFLRKNDFLPFDDTTSLEFLSVKNESPLFAFASHTKKRPNNLILGRMFDGHLLDMFEFGVENVKLLKDFKNQKITPGVKPILVFSGESFETEFEYMKLKNYFTDFFSGPKVDGIRLSGLESVVQIVAAENRIHFRCFRILLKKSGSRIPRVELEEIGPMFDLNLRRFKLASNDLYKLSMRQPQALRPKKVKNVDVSALGTTFGRIHMERQDYGKLAVKQIRSMKQDRRHKSNRSMDDRIKDIYGPVAGREETRETLEPENAQNQSVENSSDKIQVGKGPFKNRKRASDDGGDSFGRKKQQDPFENKPRHGQKRIRDKRSVNRGNNNAKRFKN